MSRIKIGIIGTGGLGTSLGSGVVDHERAELVALADIDEDARTAAGAELGIQPDAQYEDLDSMLAGEGLDAMVVATPHTLHFDQIQRGLDAGLHVLCEKPLVTTVEDARTLVERDEETDSVLMVGYQRHLESQYRYARDRWADGDHTPEYVNAEIGENWIESYTGTWRTDYDLSGGGFMFDTGSHLIDVLLWALGEEPDYVSADMDFHDDEGRIEANASVRIRFESGVVADLTMPGDVGKLSEWVHVWDDEGSVYFERKTWSDYDVSVVDEDNEERVPDISGFDTQSKIDAFVEAIQTGTEPPATAADALRALAVKEAAYESDRTGERVPVTVE